MLTIGRQKIACHIHDVSLTGFGIVVLQPLPILEDKLGRLQIGELVYIVRVARQEVKRHGVLVALEQVEEIVPNLTVTPATAFGRWMTRLAWVAAIGIVAVALYCVSNAQANALLSFHS